MLSSGVVAVALSALPAAAGEWREPQPYLLPRLDVSLVSVAGRSSAQASVGLTGGMRVRYVGKPNVLSNTRAAAVGSYGLNTGSFGGDFRLGSFVGPQGQFVLLQVGPDVWFNGYGQPGALDYHLPWSPGVDLRSQLTITPIREFSLVGEVTPGWAFVAERQTGGVGPFHELTLTALAVIRADQLRLTVGYTRQYRSFGALDGLILSGAL